MGKGNGIMTKISGKVGDLVYRINRGEQIVSAYNPRVANPKTPAQMEQRVKWGNVINAYKALQPYMKDCFEIKRHGQTDYSRFVSLNVLNTTIYLPHSDVTMGACVATDFTVSQGSLPSVQVTGTDNTAYTDIRLGDLTIDATTTIGQFAQAVVTNNSDFRYGDQISYLSLLQDTNAEEGYPFVIPNGYKINLDPLSQEILWEVGCSYGFSTNDGKLGHGEYVGQGAFCWIHSRKGLNRILVSGQRLIANNPLAARYQSEYARVAAMESYRVGEDIFIRPDGVSSGIGTDGANAGVIVNTVQLDDTPIVAGSTTRSLSKSEHTLLLTGNNLNQAQTVEIITGNDAYIAGTTPITATGSPQGVTRWQGSFTIDEATYIYGLRINGNNVAEYVPQSNTGDRPEIE